VLRTLLQLTALILSMEAAVYLAIGSAGLSPQLIAELAATKWGHNLAVARSLAEQAVYSRIGVLLLLVALVLQVANTLWPLRWKDFGVDQRGAVLALLVGIVVGGVSWWIAGRWIERTVTHATAIISAKQGKANQEQARNSPRR
jgi:hypothetical protein